MMYGSRDVFDYLECPDCASVQIATVPSQEDLQRHYPADYYSFVQLTGVRRWLAGRRDRHAFGRFDPLGALWAKRRPDRGFVTVVSAGLQPEQRIVDVGCGGGELLDRFARLGFRSLVGVDPFVPDGRRTPAGVEVRGCYLAELTGEFDVVMFNHSLEHVPDPLAELGHAARLLVPGGRCLVRLPTTSSLAWRTYRQDWMQLDPPRHIMVPSRRGMGELAQRAGFDLERTVDDSGPNQFLVSELYRRDIPLYDSDTLRVTTQLQTAFSAQQHEEYAAKATQLNAEGDGDQAMFVLRRL